MMMFDVKVIWKDGSEPVVFEEVEARHEHVARAEIRDSLEEADLLHEVARLEVRLHRYPSTPMTMRDFDALLLGR